MSRLNYVCDRCWHKKSKHDLSVPEGGDGIAKNCLVKGCDCKGSKKEKKHEK